MGLGFRVQGLVFLSKFGVPCGGVPFWGRPPVWGVPFWGAYFGEVGAGGGGWGSEPVGRFRAALPSQATTPRAALFSLGSGIGV